MSSFFTTPHMFTLALILYLTLSSTPLPATEATVAANDTFKYLNQGEFGIYVNEYDADYRVLPIATHPFQLAFYNTTPNAYTLALRMGAMQSESDRKWVWEANRGDPVGDNASLTLGPDGNLVLADADGRVAWQTNTRNKGVVGLDVLPNGNMVLYDAKGRYVWQSFDSATNTLMVGQGLGLRKAARLMSRLSTQMNVDGPYSFVVEPKRLAMYYATKIQSPMIYYASDRLGVSVVDSIESATLNCSAYVLSLIYRGRNGKAIGSTELARTTHDCSLSFLRLEIDGNLRVYTYDDNVDWGAWDFPFTLFDRESKWETECQLPGRCGGFGLCEEDQCVGCPTKNGLMGWSKNCQGPNVATCRPNKVGYFDVKGVEHWMVKYNKGGGPMKMGECRSKCTKDGSCMGYFYHGDTSLCWIARDLHTLTKVVASTHLGFIKTCIH